MTGSEQLSFSCSEGEQLVPFLLNGSLDTDERIALMKHLRTCTPCRAELLDAAFVWAATDSHPPADVLIEYGAGRAILDYPRDVLEAHLASCQICNDSVVALEQFDLTPAANESHLARTSPGGFADAATVAPDSTDSEESLAAGESTSAEQSRTRVRDSSTRFAPVEQRHRQWLPLVAVALFAALATGLLTQLMERRDVAINFETFELLPAEYELRSGSSLREPADGAGFERAPRVQRSGSAGLVLVPADTPRGSGARVVVRQTDGAQVLVLDGLEQTQTGDYTLLLPPRRLAAGDYLLVLEERAEESADSAWRTLGKYQVVVE